MSLELHFHPLASFCHKVLIAFYENGTPVRAGHRRSRRRGLERRLPGGLADGKMPVLRDEARATRSPESTHHRRVSGRCSTPARHGCIPADPDAAWQTRHVGPLLRPLRPGADAEDRDRPAAAGGRERCPWRGAGQGAACDAYALIEQEMATRTWVWARRSRWPTARPRQRSSTPTRSSRSTTRTRRLPAYLGRLMARPSFARVLKEAEPYFALFPG